MCLFVGTLIGALQVPVSLLVGDTLGGSQSYCTLLSQMLVIKKLQRKLPYLMQYRHGVENWWQVNFRLKFKTKQDVSPTFTTEFGFHLKQNALFSDQCLFLRNILIKILLKTHVTALVE